MSDFEGTSTNFTAYYCDHWHTVVKTAAMTMRDGLKTHLRLEPQIRYVRSLPHSTLTNSNQQTTSTTNDELLSL